MKVSSKKKGENQIKPAEAEAKAKILGFETDWERTMASNQAGTYKDEWLVLLFSITLILFFVEIRAGNCLKND